MSSTFSVPSSDLSKDQKRTSSFYEDADHLEAVPSRHARFGIVKLMMDVPGKEKD